MGTLSLALFAILFFRLWFLQVLSSDQYAQCGVGELHPAGGDRGAPGRDPRPQRDHPRLQPARLRGADLAARPAGAAHPKLLAHPPRQDAALYNRLAHVVGLPTKRQKCTVGFLNPNAIRRASTTRSSTSRRSPARWCRSTSSCPTPRRRWPPTSPARSSTTCPSARPPSPGVSVQQIYQRTYPLNDVAAQVLGIVSRITASEVKNPFYKGASQNDSVGQSGLEASYDRYLRGVDGAQRVQVDALGNFVGVMSQVPPTRRQQPQAVARRQARAGRPAGAPGVDRLELPGQRRRVRCPEPGQRPGLRDGLAAHLQREPVHQAGPPVGLRRDVRAHLGRSAGQPRRPGRRTDRLDVQADHRDRGARERRVEHQRASSTTPVSSASRDSAGTTPAGRWTARST